MIRTFIAYDNNDFELGDYFDDSHTDIIDEIVANKLIQRTSISGLECTEVKVNECIQAFNGLRFVFVGLSHGNEQQLISNEAFVSATNAAAFTNSFFYTCACSTGDQLGGVLIEAGCLVYIGYNDTVLLHVDYYQVFYKCQNFGIKSFLLNKETINVSFDKMIAYYNEEIERLVNEGGTDEVIASSFLLSNRDGLILLGNGNLTPNDFFAN